VTDTGQGALFEVANERARSKAYDNGHVDPGQRSAADEALRTVVADVLSASRLVDSGWSEVPTTTLARLRHALGRTS